MAPPVWHGSFEAQPMVTVGRAFAPGFGSGCVHSVSCNRYQVPKAQFGVQKECSHR